MDKIMIATNSAVEIWMNEIRKVYCFSNPVFVNNVLQIKSIWYGNQSRCKQVSASNTVNSIVSFYLNSLNLILLQFNKFYRIIEIRPENCI